MEQKRTLRNLKPIVIENSRVPGLLEKFSPIQISCITLFPFIFCKGALGKILRNHEEIHFQQQLETGVIGFYVLYILNYFLLRLDGFKAVDSYYELQAEREAYGHELDFDYLLHRKRWRWIIRG